MAVAAAPWSVSTRTAVLVGALSLASAAAPAFTHHQATPHVAVADEVAIPSLTHGQMTVIAANLSEIRALADAQVPTDPLLRRLQAFVNLQMFACLWGIVAGTVTDEASPFNECAHAYLAAARALLLHLQQMPGANQTAIDALVNRINTDMQADPSAWVVCGFSERPFNTGELITPHWQAIPLHPPSLATLLVAGAFMAVSARLLARLLAGVDVGSGRPRRSGGSCAADITDANGA